MGQQTSVRDGGVVGVVFGDEVVLPDRPVGRENVRRRIGRRTPVEITERAGDQTARSAAGISTLRAARSRSRPDRDERRHLTDALEELAAVSAESVRSALVESADDAPSPQRLVEPRPVPVPVDDGGWQADAGVDRYSTGKVGRFR
jgi:hypothetical protein